MTTVHAYTNDQKILDQPHKDLRRARAAAVNIIPTTTGAAKVVGIVIPELQGKLHGIALRVPVSVVSIVDFVADLEKQVTVEQVNQAFKAAANGALKGILEYCDEELVSSDFKGNPYSCIVDALSTLVMDRTMVKTISWYDNEWGYSLRCVDLLQYMIKKG
jgi:glyceraldehyde 3-phosphate dehydrogenase